MNAVLSATATDAGCRKKTKIMLLEGKVSFLRLSDLHETLKLYDTSSLFKQIRIFLYLLSHLCFKLGLGSRMGTASKRYTFGRI